MKKSDREGPEKPHLLGVAQLGSVKAHDIECHFTRFTMDEDQIEKRHQHQRTSGHRIKHEFDQRVVSTWPAPNAENESHREEHQLPEQKEQEKIDRDQCSQHSPLEDEDKEHEFLRSVPNIGPRAEQDNRGKHRGQQDQPDREPVDADGVGNSQGRHPGNTFHHLQMSV
jgi:hypothetical protein